MKKSTHAEKRIYPGEVNLSCIMCINFVACTSALLPAINVHATRHLILSAIVHFLRAGIGRFTALNYYGFGDRYHI